MRGVTDFCIKNYQFIIILTILLLLLGRLSYTSLPIEQNPDIQIPLVYVVVVYPGASPEDMERDVTEKIEEYVEDIKEKDFIVSVSSEGVSTIIVRFKAGDDLEKALRDVRDKVDLARPELPDDAEDPLVTDLTTSDIPTLILSIAADRPEMQMADIADEIKDKVEGLASINRVEVFGKREREIHVKVDPGKFEHHGVGFLEIVRALGSENMNVPAGSMELGSTKFSLRTPNRFTTLKDIEDVVIARRGGQPIYLVDAAEVVQGFEKRESYGRLNGRPAINFNIYKKDNANTIRTSAEVKSLLEEIRSTLPSDVEFVFIGDQAKRAKSSINLMLNMAKSGVVLVILVIFVFLGFRNSILISLTLPLSLTFTFVWLWLSGYSLNGVTVFGLVVVIGILVDDAIIIIENIYRWMERGYSRLEASLLGTHEVGNAILYSGATTIAAFAPMLVMSGTTGEFMKFIPITVISAIIGAITIAHTVMPALASRFLRIRPRTKKRGRGFFHRVKYLYARVLKLLLRKPLVFPIAVTVLWFASIGLVVSGALDIEFFPSTPTEQVIFTVSTPVGANLDETDRIVKKAEERMERFRDELLYLAANVGMGGGTTAHFDFSGAGPNYGEVRGELKNDNIDYIRGFTDKIQNLMDDIPGAEIELDVLQAGPPIDKPIVVRLAGEDMAVLDELANKVKRLLSGVEGIIEITDNLDPTRPEIEVNVDRARAIALGVTPAEVAGVVRLAYNGIEATEFFDETRNESVDVIVKFPEELAENPTQLARLRILNKSGQPIPVNQVASVQFTTGPQAIKRRDGKRTAEVRADVLGISAFEGLQRARNALSNMVLPTGYSLSYAGENEERDESFRSLGVAMIVAVFVIYLLLVLKFNSVLQPLVIMAAIPFSMIGVVLGLLITNNAFGIMAFIGMVALSGIVVNDSIVLIHYTNQLRAQGKKKALALWQACLDRMRPILLTSITTIFGILPLATGFAMGGKNASAVMWAPLGWAIVFGLMMSTFLILLVVPSIYLILTWLEEEFIPRIFTRRNRV